MSFTEFKNENLRVAAIVVTYGDRWLYLRNTLLALENDHLVTASIVVDNASLYDVASACQEIGFSKTTVITNNENLGSASGFTTGITHSMELGADFLFLLDDDNLPQSGTLTQLLSSYTTVKRQFSEPIAIAAYRKCQYDSFWNLPEKLLLAHDDFMGFNIFNALQRHLTIDQQGNTKKSGTEYFNVKRCGPFSGMFFSSNLIQTIGLPRQDMVIYYDDVEWVIRILNSGGTVWLDTEAINEEQNTNYAASVFNKPIIGMIFADSESKIYYLIRNRIYIDAYIEKKNGFLYMVNKFTFLGMLLLGSLLLGRIKRIITVLTAYIDGSKGNLGMNSRYELT